MTIPFEPFLELGNCPTFSTHLQLSFKPAGTVKQKLLSIKRQEGNAVATVVLCDR